MVGQGKLRALLGGQYRGGGLGEPMLHLTVLTTGTDDSTNHAQAKSYTKHRYTCSPKSNVRKICTHTKTVYMIPFIYSMCDRDTARWKGLWTCFAC